jgi:hypothetical protein
MVTVRLLKEMDREYIVGELLGSGGFGTVYSGYRRRDSLPVSSIKYLCLNKHLS